MLSACKASLLAAVLLAASISLTAQDQGSHGSASAGSAGHASVSASGSHGGTFGPGGRTSSPGISNNGGRSGNPPGHPRLPNAYPRSFGYGYGYAYGAPYMLPYDSEYDQLEGRGSLDQGQPQEPPDNRVGPTIFEHNGRVSSAIADSRSVRPKAQENRAEESSSEPAGTPAVLVFRDGHQQEVENYAIAGNKLIVLGDDKTQKIELSDLDLGATAKANQERGVDFKLPHQG